MQKHRADLQGVRAVAVAMVVFYHLNIGWVPGGFVGVDVFFVLSGFLITRVLYFEAVNTGTIDLASFWLRRAKRLLPNAILTLFSVIVASWLLLSPYRWDSISRDVVSAAVFLSNFRFSSNATDYFHFDDPPSPILHFWSLSIEEQFYFALPIMLFLLLPALRLRPRITLTVLLSTICMASFTLSLVVGSESQPAAFFGTHTRIWQLAIGGLLGVNYDLRCSIHHAIRGFSAWVGLGLIAYAALLFSDDLVYPGLYALVPTFGGVLMILGLDASHAAPLRNWLSTLPMRWIGDRSYSIYLWHWPIIVFAREIITIDAGSSLLLIALTITVSHLAYLAVEYPIHRMDMRLWPRWAFASCAAGAIAMASTSSFALTHANQSTKSAARSEAIHRASRDLGANYSDGCHADFEQIEQADCTSGTLRSRKKVVLFGDSHAAQWAGALSKAALQEGWELRSWTKTSCPPADVAIWYPPKKATYFECPQWRNTTIGKIVHFNPSVVVMVATALYSGWIAKGDRVLRGDDAAAEFQRGMIATIDKLSANGRQIVIIRDNPSMYRGYKDCLSFGQGDCGRPRSEALGRSLDFVSNLKASRPAIKILDLTDRACDDRWCPAIRDSQILYLDQHHFTATFTKSIWRDFLPILAASDNQAAKPR